MGRVLLGLFVLFVLLPAAGPPTPDARSSNVEAQPAIPADASIVMATRPAGWYPIYQTGGQAIRIAVDGARARILVAARFWGLPSSGNNSTESSNLMVLNLSGILLHNISLSPATPSYVADFALDDVTGYAYVSFNDGTVARVDPGAGQVARSWNYGKRLLGIAAQNGVVFVSTCCDMGTIMRIDSDTGAILRTYTPAGQGGAMSMAIDPAGRWLFIAMTDVLVGRIFRMNLTSGQADALNSGNSVRLSADGRRVWICGWGELTWYWLANDTWGFSPASCPDSRIADNPVTGVVALAGSGRFIDETGDVSTFHFQDNVEGYPWQGSDVGWTAEGTALVVLAWSLSQVYVGLWDGDPWLNATDGRLLNPNVDQVCYPLVTAGGLNFSSLIRFRDDVVLAGGESRANEACFGRAEDSALPLADGTHVGRIVGFDRAGRPLNGTVTFETDGTPPTLAVESPRLTETVPFALRGTVDDPHLAYVVVGQELAALSSRNWSAPISLWIGNNTVGARAVDTVGNEASVTTVVRYWPAFRNDLRNSQQQFHISTPPGWTRAMNFYEHHHFVGAAVFAPREGTYVYNTSAKVWTEPHPGIQETQAAAYALAVEGAKEVEGSRFSLRSIRNLTLDGHAAAEFSTYVGGDIIGTNTTLAILTQTYVVSGERAQVYVISFRRSWMQPQFTETEAWILESFHIEPPTPLEPNPQVPILVLGGLVAGATAVGAVIVLFFRRRGSLGPRIPPGERQTLVISETVVAPTYAHKPIPSRRMVVLTVGVVVAVIVLAGSVVLFLGRPPSMPEQIVPMPPASGDGFEIFIDSVRIAQTYGGRDPTRNHWLIVTSTVRNAGIFSVLFKAEDWVIADPSGSLWSHPDPHLYGSQSIGSTVYVTYWLLFDLAVDPQPDRLILTVPTGREIGSPISGGHRGVGIYLGRSNDGTNWSLTITSRPDGLRASDTTFSVVTEAGGLALASTPFSDLNYGFHRVAYVASGDGVSVGVGDELVVSTATYPAGYRYRISDGSVLLADGTFPSY